MAEASIVCIQSLSGLTAHYDLFLISDTDAPDNILHFPEGGSTAMQMKINSFAKTWNTRGSHNECSIFDTRALSTVFPRFIDLPTN